MSSAHDIDLNYVGSEPGVDVPAAQQISILRFPAGAVLYSAGATFNGVYLVRSGMAKTTHRLEGTDVLTSLVLDGNFLGIDSLHSSTYLSQATSVLEMVAVWIPSDILVTLLRNDDAFRSLVSDAIGKALAESVLMVQMLSKSAAEERVAFLLVKLFCSSSTELRARKILNIGLSRSEIAAYLGLRLETVSRKLAFFTSMGFIGVRGRWIHVRNYDGLRKICKSSYLLLNEADG